MLLNNIQDSRFQDKAHQTLGSMSLPTEPQQTQAVSSRAAATRDKFRRSPNSSSSPAGMRCPQELPYDASLGSVYAPLDFSSTPRTTACPSWNIMLERHAAARAAANARRSLLDLMERLAECCCFDEMAQEQEADGEGIIPRQAEPIRRPGM